MSGYALTSPGLLKAQAFRGLAEQGSIGEILKGFVSDKGYSERAVIELANSGIFGLAVSSLLLRGGVDNKNAEVHTLDYFGRRIRTSRRRTQVVPPYTGEPAQAQTIDRILTNLNSGSAFVGEGVMGRVTLPKNLVRGHSMRHTPIAIVGHGAAGIMVAHGLETLGFANISIFEKKKSLGIWSLPTVYQGSRNNPRPILFGNHELSQAPGDGEEVRRFLLRIKDSTDSRLRGERHVTEIIPSDLDHGLSSPGAEPEDFPIVINAIGVGSPVPLSDPERMLARADGSVPIRWQNPEFGQYEDLGGKRFIFIGLGNSTAEMLRQIHALQDRGIDVDYRVLTHYPIDAVFNPTDTVHLGKRDFRVFRDLSRPTLTSFQGDLETSRYDYYRALHGGRIISDVKEWRTSGNKMMVRTRRERIELNYHRVYALTGYRHEPEVLRRMGCTYDVEGRFAHHDYDGEMIKSPGARGAARLHRGYFGFGAVLDAPHNPNISVIPGMAYRLPDLLFGVVMRAMEHHQGLD